MTRSPHPNSTSNSNPKPRSTKSKSQWFIPGLIGLIILLGIGFRTINLGQKAYWVDEVHTSVRIAGYTKADITAERFDNHIHTVADLNTYQIPTADPSLTDVLQTLAQHPEHPPLYYLLARWWMQAAMAMGIPPSVTVTRSLSLLFSLLALPCVVGLVWELFRSKQTAIIALAIIALSPLHILYGQEAREYSLWTAITFLSCWILLRTLRSPSLKNWVLYGLTLTIGWYSHLLFATVAIAHTLYVAISLDTLRENQDGKLPSLGKATVYTQVRDTFKTRFDPPKSPLKRGTLNPDSDQQLIRTSGSPLEEEGLGGINQGFAVKQKMCIHGRLGEGQGYLKRHPFAIALIISFLLFTPWVGVLVHHIGQVQNVVDATQRDPSLAYLFNVWGRNLSRVWFNGDLGGANLAGVLGVVAALVYLWRTVPKRISSMILLLIGVNALALMVPDAMTGGISSTRIRYLIPAYVGIQLAIAHLFSHQISRTKGLNRRGWQMLVMIVLISGAIAGLINLSQPTNWAKSDKSIYYPQMAAAINASITANAHPLVITDNSATYTLVLAHQLDPQVQFQLVDLRQRPIDWSLKDATSVSDIFLFAPSAPLRRTLKKQGMGPFDSVVRQSDRFQLLKQSQKSEARHNPDSA